MDDSEFYYQISRSLYEYRKRTSQLLRSRTYAIGKSVKIIAKEPVRFAGKSAKLMITNPKKLYKLATGKQALQRNKEIQANLSAEYQTWVTENALTESQLVAQSAEAKKLKHRPLVSLITPVFNPPIAAHKKLIDSVLAQTYENFELLLFNFGDKSDVEELLDSYALKDKRIIVKHGLENKGIGANSNYCLDYVMGEFVGLLDHDDALTPDALFECVNAINNKDTDFIYTDKDKITEEDDNRFEPLFKPDWSPEMALGGNYMTHFNLMRTKLVKKLGGWDPETDGAQDWDLFLRIIDESDKPVIHVPKIVYHWRTVQGSTANSIGVKPYALKAQRRAVAKHLRRLGVDAMPLHDSMGQLSIKWAASKQPLLLIIHCVNNDLQNVAAFLNKNYESFSSKTKIIVYTSTDDESNKKYVRSIKQLGSKVLIKNYEQGLFVKTIQKDTSDFGGEKVIYITDSVNSLSNVHNDLGWFDQLTGWLNLPQVNIAGGGALADTGQVIDIGSYFDPEIQNFVRYHALSELRSGYNGYIQWIRNFILPASRPFAFSKYLLLEIGSDLINVRDDEFQAVLALQNYNQNNRAVYDPSVMAIDSAPFDIRLPMSSILADFTKKHCSSLLEFDPYYNNNLNNNYIDPKPKLHGIKQQDIKKYNVLT